MISPMSIHGGIDLGGTKIQAAIVDDDHDVLGSARRATPTRGGRSWADLPATSIKYIRRIEELIEAPVALLSTSPEREDTILVHNPFEA